PGSTTRSCGAWAANGPSVSSSRTTGPQTGEARDWEGIGAAMWRQGDVLIEAVESIPPSARRLKRPILASGDSTGQRHQLKDRRTGRLLAGGEGRATQLFLDVTADAASIVHPEHGPIVLPRGSYRVWRQREFADREVRFVAD